MRPYVNHNVSMHVATTWADSKVYIRTRAIPNHRRAERYKMLKGHNSNTTEMTKNIRGQISEGIAGANISVKSIYMT